MVADLETTGLSTASCEILEFAAVRVGADGAAEREYAQVVRTRATVPPFITRLTGITEAEVERQGVPVGQAFAAFLDFVEDLPVFSTTPRSIAVSWMPRRCRPACRSPTPPIARWRWPGARPELPSHKLDVLARHVGASEPTHRALADVRTTVAVALAASSAWRRPEAIAGRASRRRSNGPADLNRIRRKVPQAQITFCS